MIFILFLLDVIFYRFTSITTYFIAISPVLCEKKDLWKLILIGLFLDYMSFHTIPIETALLLFIYLMVNMLKKYLYHPTWNYYTSVILSFCLFIICNSIIFGKSLMLLWRSDIIFAIFLQICLAYCCDRKDISHIKWIR